MDNFIPPAHPLPDGQGPLSLPPRQKNKIVPPAKNLKADDEQADSSKAIENETEEEAEAKLQKMLDEEVPVIPDIPPQCDWHLDAMFAGNYPDPFALPAVHYAKQSILLDFIGAAKGMVEEVKTMQEEAKKVSTESEGENSTAK